MEILFKNKDMNLVINQEQDFKTDLGWQENAQELEDQTLEKIINPVDNYETVRYIHQPYDSLVSGSTVTLLQSDIWFKFHFLTTGNTYVTDYEPTGLSFKENNELKEFFKRSFFRLEFYKTPNGEPPTRANRRLVFTKNLPLTSGEKYNYYKETRNGSNQITAVTDMNIFKPVFIGTNYKNSENLYIFWFQDDSPFEETNLIGNVFYMTAKFFNAENGEVTDFVTNSDVDEDIDGGRYGVRSRPIEFYEKNNSGGQIIEPNDMYYCVTIDRTDFTYTVNRDCNCVFTGGSVKLK
jgi:hypothetical protein